MPSLTQKPTQSQIPESPFDSEEEAGEPIEPDQEDLVKLIDVLVAHFGLTPPLYIYMHLLFNILMFTKVCEDTRQCNNSDNSLWNSIAYAIILNVCVALSCFEFVVHHCIKYTIIYTIYEASH